MKKIFILIVLFIGLISIACKKDNSIKDNDIKDNEIKDDEIKDDEIKDDEIKDDEIKEDENMDEAKDDKANNMVELPLIPLNPELPHMPDNLVSEYMQKNALMAEGNLSRLAAVMDKAKKGESVTIGFIGGSITQGSSATSNEESYAYYVHKWWQEAFPDTEVKFINAGVGATTSYLGVHRVDDDLLKDKPDLVVVEFSVNDSDTTFYKKTYEDLVRKILKSENNPAVLLLFTTMDNGTSAQLQHLFIGLNYDLPRISYRQAVLKEMEEGRISWNEISPDNIHPNNKGHAIIGEIMWNFFNNVYLRLDNIDKQVKPLDMKAVFSNAAYEDAKIYNNTMIEAKDLGSFTKESVHYKFKDNWTTSTGDKSIVFEINAKNIGIMYEKLINGKGGQYEVYIDDELCKTLNANFEKGWGNYVESEEVFSSKEKKPHKIEIRKSETSTGDYFGIIGLLIS